MNRESDEECLALIATIRDRAGDTAGLAMRAETDRLLDNLEARINGDVRRAWHRDHQDAEPEQRVHLTEDCPCGAESCREAWRELRQAKHDAEQGAIRSRDIREEVAAEVERRLREEVANEIAAQVLPMAERHAGVLDAWIRQVRGRDTFRARTEAEFRAEFGEQREAQADEPTEAETRAFESARLDLRKGMPNFRDMIREEVAAEVERQMLKLTRFSKALEAEAS